MVGNEDGHHGGSDCASVRLHRCWSTTSGATHGGCETSPSAAGSGEIYDGGSRSDAARIGDVGLQIIRDWVLRFNAEGPDGLIDRKAPGPEPRLTEMHRQALVAAIESGPIPAVHGVVRWRLIDLCQWLWEEFRVSVARQTLGRELRGLGYRKLSARPRHHAQTEGAIEHFKKVSRRSWQRSRGRKTSRRRQ